MKRFNSRNYLYIALGGVGVILLLTVYFLFCSLLKGGETQYVYIDKNDTLDSVFAKISPIATNAGMSALKTMARHTDYGESIHTGRYAINPGESVITVFRKLRSGQQSSLRLTIPEVRTMDRLAAFLGHRLMMDSAEVADVLLSEDGCQHYGYDTATIASLFVPNTYEVYWNTSVENFMERMQKEHDHFWSGERQEKRSPEAADTGRGVHAGQHRRRGDGKQCREAHDSRHVPEPSEAEHAPAGRPYRQVRPEAV